MKVTAGYLTRGPICREFLGSLEASAHLFDGGIIRRGGSYRVDMERNRLAEDILATEPDVVLLLDDDHSFLPWQAERLIASVDSGRPVVSGLYFAVESRHPSSPHIRPLVLRRNGDACQTMWDYERNSLVSVDCIGLGFVAIAAWLLREWRDQHGPTWFDFDKRSDGSHCLEDEAFSSRVRYELRYPLYVHAGICVKHWKRWGFDESDYDRQRQWQDNRNISDSAFR